MGPLRASSEGHRYLLTLKDVFSKWLEAIPHQQHDQREGTVGPSDALCMSLVIPCRFIRTTTRTSGHRQCRRPSSKPASDSPSRQPTIRSPTPWKGLTATSTPCCASCATNTLLTGKRCYMLPFWLSVVLSMKAQGVTPFACLYGQEASNTRWTW